MEIKNDVKFNESFQVSERQYTLVYSYFGGLIARRRDGDNYFIKILVMKYSKQIINTLNKIN